MEMHKVFQGQKYPNDKTKIDRFFLSFLLTWWSVMQGKPEFKTKVNQAKASIDDKTEL